MIICLGTTPAIGRTMSFDHLSIDSVNRAVEVHQHPAGKSINAANVLHTLGKPVLALGFLGGYSGQFIRDHLDQIQLPHDFLPVSPATRICVTVIDRSAKTATELVEEAQHVPEQAYEKLITTLQSHIPNAKALILSGTLTPNAPPDFYARCVDIAVRANIPVVLDAKGDPLRRTLPSRPTIVKPNRTELEETVGMQINSDATMKQAISHLIAAGPKWVVVTAGPDQTIASDGRSFWRISTPKVHVVSPIGSGDSFAAGLTAALTAGESVPQACCLAVACGAANAMTPLAGHLHPVDVHSLLPQITATPW